MKKLCRFGLLLLITLIAVSFSAISSSAAEVKKTSVDTVGAVMAKNAYEVVVKSEGINLVKGKKMQLTAEVTNVKKQPAITWKSSDTSVATIDENGMVKGEGVGRALITATAKVAGQTVEGYYSINVITSKNFVKNFMEGNQIVSYQYSYVDDYYYTNDKEAWQYNFGFGKIYDFADLDAGTRLQFKTRDVRSACNFQYFRIHAEAF